MKQIWFSKIPKKLSAQMQKAKAKAKAKAKTAQHQEVKAKMVQTQVVKAKPTKPQQTKCASSTKKETADLEKSAEMNIQNSAKNISNTEVLSSVHKDVMENAGSHTQMSAETR
jgi:uncharacterized membrane protein